MCCMRKVRNQLPRVLKIFNVILKLSLFGIIKEKENFWSLGSLTKTYPTQKKFKRSNLSFIILEGSAPYGG